jgi:transcription-repair coupling factor (superfamily II helicase)
MNTSAEEVTGSWAVKTDVLVSTTIIETGLDIPNAKHHHRQADQFSLADLYQLRDRSGEPNTNLLTSCSRDMMTVGSARRRIILSNSIRSWSGIQNRDARSGDRGAGNPRHGSKWAIINLG